MNDESVRRANGLTTTFLDTLGILLLAAAVGWWLWEAVHPAAGLAAAGVVVTALSLIAQRQNSLKVIHREPPQTETPPGPEDPGPVHVMGR